VPSSISLGPFSIFHQRSDQTDALYFKQERMGLLKQWWYVSKKRMRGSVVGAQQSEGLYEAAACQPLSAAIWIVSPLFSVKIRVDTVLLFQKRASSKTY